MQRHRNKVSKPSPEDQHDASLLTTQEKLSARQAKRAAKAAERREKSEALKEEGNAFFRKGDYQSAVDRYQEAIRVHGRSVKPVLLTNLAVAYHNLGKFCEASEAAEKALFGDPKSVKARYRRAMARKNMEMWSAAAIDFRVVLRLDPRYQEVKKELAYVEKCRCENWFLDEDGNCDSEYEFPAPDDEPELGESLSESSDCEHAGNGKPCKFYNHTECTKGRACLFSHAPDYQSERDALGRNVCRYYLMGLCRFGERCSYLHSKEFLVQEGWWSTAEGIDKAKRIYEVQQKFKQAAIDYEKKDKSSLNPETGPAPKKKRSRGKKKSPHRARSDLGRLRSEVAAAISGGRSIQAESGQSSRLTNSIGQTKYTVDSHSSPKDYDSDGGDEEYSTFGFTNSEVEELLCHGIKPWGDIDEARSIPVARNNSLLIQEKLFARQADRAAKAAERREKSDALEEEGNAFFHNGNFQDALDRYQQAIDVHGPSAKPVLLTNLAVAYLKLGRYAEAHDAADRALAADPTSVKARYYRGMARKHMEMWIAADIDFRALLALDPGNKDAEGELAFVEEMRRDPSYWEEEEDVNGYSDYEGPTLEDDPEFGESLSESSDCEHTGNGIPCKFYNRTECKNGRACRFSHAPDQKSERDALGRNVCRYYLIGICKFGERCSYLHSKEYLLRQGWWSTTEGIDKERKRYDLIQMCNKAIVDYKYQANVPGTGQTSRKKQPKMKKRRDLRARSDLWGSDAGVAIAKNHTLRAPSASRIGQSSQRVGMKSKKKPTVYSYSNWEGYDSDGDDENGLAMCGFTGSQVEELVCHGVKPWDDDAWDVLDALHEF